MSTASFPAAALGSAAVTPAGVAWAQRAMAARPDRTEVLRGLSVPAVVVYGVEDAFIAGQVRRHMLPLAQDAAGREP